MKRRKKREETNNETERYLFLASSQVIYCYLQEFGRNVPRNPKKTLVKELAKILDSKSHSKKIELVSEILKESGSDIEVKIKRNYASIDVLPSEVKVYVLSFYEFVLGGTVWKRVFQNLNSPSWYIEMLYGYFHDDPCKIIFKIFGSIRLNFDKNIFPSDSCQKPKSSICHTRLSAQFNGVYLALKKGQNLQLFKRNFFCHLLKNVDNLELTNYDSLRVFQLVDRENINLASIIIEKLKTFIPIKQFSSFFSNYRFKSLNSIDLYSIFELSRKYLKSEAVDIVKKNNLFERVRKKPDTLKEEDEKFFLDNFFTHDFARKWSFLKEFNFPNIKAVKVDFTKLFDFQLKSLEEYFFKNIESICLSCPFKNVVDPFIMDEYFCLLELLLYLGNNQFSLMKKFKNLKTLKFEFSPFEMFKDKENLFDTKELLKALPRGCEIILNNCEDLEVVESIISSEDLKHKRFSLRYSFKPIDNPIVDLYIDRTEEQLFSLKGENEYLNLLLFPPTKFLDILRMELGHNYTHNL